MAQVLCIYLSDLGLKDKQRVSGMGSEVDNWIVNKFKAEREKLVDLNEIFHQAC